MGKRTCRTAALAMVAAGALLGCGGGDGDGKKPEDDAATPLVDGGAKPEGGTVTMDDGGRDAGRDAGRDTGAQVTPDSGPDVVPEDPAVPPVPGSNVPELSKIGYFDDELGLRILLQGIDPNGDVASYTVKLFKTMGTGSSATLAPASVQTETPDGTVNVTEFTNTVTPVAGDARFTYRFDPSSELREKVDTIKVTVTDSGGRISDELTAKVMVAPTATTTCDPLGFNKCAASSACNLSNNRYVCSAIATARNNACTSAQELRPPTVSSVRGVLKPSLWDSPTGCVSNDPRVRADTVVKLHLDTAATRVVLSTNNEYTTVTDTSLYLLQMCREQPAACVDTSCACADDVAATGTTPRQRKAVLTLNNLAAGDHFIVVDSVISGQIGGVYELTATVE